MFIEKIQRLQELIDLECDNFDLDPETTKRNVQLLTEELNKLLKDIQGKRIK